MFGGNRRARYSTLAIFALGLFFFLFIPLAVNQEYKAHQQVADQSRGSGYGSSPNQIAVPITSIDGFNPWNDTVAQWLMAVFAFAATGVSIYAVRVLRRTLEATNEAVRSADEAVEVTRKHGQIQLRPQLVVAVGGIAFTSPSNGDPPAIHCTIRIDNKGATPAFDVSASLDAWSAIGGQPTIAVVTFEPEIGQSSYVGDIIEGDPATLGFRSQEGALVALGRSEAGRDPTNDAAPKLIVKAVLVHRDIFDVEHTREYWFRARVSDIGMHEVHRIPYPGDQYA